MPWYAKPAGGYGIDSVEGTANIEMMNGFFNGEGYALSAQAGIMGNVNNESALNPWRWEEIEGGGVDYSRGYGLFQYTPASGYINGCRDLLGYAPNLSTTRRTPGAQPYDGWAQLICFNENTLGKWVSACWRDYWPVSAYAELYTLRAEVLRTWGNGTSLTLEQFKHIENLVHATFAFLACFEGPTVPNLSPRIEDAQYIYFKLTGEWPPEPPKPKHGNFKIWFALRHR